MSLKMAASAARSSTRRTNILLNSNFELDTDADGLCDNWTGPHTTAVAQTFTRVTSGGLVSGTYAQRMYYAGAVADDGSKGVQIRQSTASGVAFPGAVCTFKIWITGSFTVSYGYIGIESQTSAGDYIGEGIQAFTPTGTPQLISVTYTAPATTSRIAAFVISPELYTTSIVDLTFDAASLSIV